MITSIIIDDEQHCIDALSADLSKHCGNVEIIANVILQKREFLL
ncbi:hypothetical protein BH10BAC3_BH10BAC3_15750 [soil metagenome]